MIGKIYIYIIAILLFSTNSMLFRCRPICSTVWMFDVNKLTYLNFQEQELGWDIIRIARAISIYPHARHITVSFLPFFVVCYIFQEFGNLSIWSIKMSVVHWNTGWTLWVDPWQVWSICYRRLGLASRLSLRCFCYRIRNVSSSISQTRTNARKGILLLQRSQLYEVWLY